jgi:hypothetical protein
VRLIRFVLPALLCLAALAYLIDLGGSSIWDANEAYYVETPREMLERGDWVNPTFNYEPRFNKPVLAYWVVAVLYQVFGVSVGVERIAIAGLALVVIAAAWFLARAASLHPGRAGARGSRPRREPALLHVRAPHPDRRDVDVVHDADSCVLCAGGALSRRAAGCF